MRILGIDPGSQTTGIGLIDITGNHAHPRYFGTLRPKSGDPLPDRLVTLVRGVRAVIEEHQPDYVAIETAFYHKSAKSALVLGQVRGALLVCARELDCPVLEFSPREIKQAVTGNGGASKVMVQRLVTGRLSLPKTPTSDAADALGAALCAWQRIQTKALGLP